jgi:hypothetical protein
VERDLTDIARRGLDAAGALVERFAEVVETSDGSSGAIEAVGQAWGEVIRTTATAWSGAGGGSKALDEPRLDIDASGGIVVPVVVSGAAGRAEFWLHNPTGEPLESVRFVPGPLRTASGAADDARLRLAPEQVAPVAARSSRGIEVAVEAPNAVVGDRLRSLVVVDGIDDVWAVIDVTVE